MKDFFDSYSRKESDIDGNNTVNLSYALKRSDLFWYNFHFLRLLAAGAAFFFALAIAGSILVLWAPIGDLRTALIWAEIGFGLGFSLCAGPVAGVTMQIFFFKSGTVDRAMTRRSYIIDDGGIAIFNDRGRIARTWNEVKTIIRTRHGFYLRTSDKLAIVIPRRELRQQNDLETFQKILRHKH